MSVLIRLVFIIGIISMFDMGCTGRPINSIEEGDIPDMEYICVLDSIGITQ